MGYLYLLAGEDLELAEAELNGFLRSQNVDEKAERDGRLAFTETEPEQLKRLALVHEVSEVLERSKKPDSSYRPEASFAVRVEDLTGKRDTKELEKQFGDILSNNTNSVDLDSPEELLKVYVTKEEYILSQQVEDIDRGLFEKRKNQRRPFSSPISLDPVLARIMVNLSEVPPGGKILDPFCGTGGILIEAGLCGISVHGADIQQEMVEGARENLEEYGIISHDIRKSGISSVDKVFEQKFDAVVTDLPYGKSSKTEGNPLEDFLTASNSLSEHKTVFMSDRDELNGFEPDFEIYVHKSMNRYIYVLD